MTECFHAYLPINTTETSNSFPPDQSNTTDFISNATKAIYSFPPDQSNTTDVIPDTWRPRGRCWNAWRGERLMQHWWRVRLNPRGPCHMVGHIVTLSPKAKDKMKRKHRRYETVFKALCEPELPRGDIAALSRVTGLKPSTLSWWRGMLFKDKTWRPFLYHYGQHRRHFTEDEEAQIIAKIRRDWLDRGLFYSDQDFIHDMKKYYQEAMWVMMEIMMPAVCSPLTKVCCSRAAVSGKYQNRSQTMSKSLSLLL